MIHTVKGFSITHEAEVGCFFGTPLLSPWSIECWQFDLWFLYLSETRVVHLEVLISHTVKPSWKDFEHNLARMWNVCNCMVVGTFFGIAFLGDWNENWTFPVLWPLLSFQICCHIECSPVTASSFRILNNSAEIPLPPLAVLVMLPKALLTSHSRVSGSRWVTTPSRLSWSFRCFFYSSSVYSCHLFLISSTSARSLMVRTFCPLSCPSLHEMFSWYLQFSWRDL